MKQVQMLLFLLIATSCGTKDNFNDFISGNSFKQKSTITPLFEAKTFAEKHGDGRLVTVNVKVPLTKETIESYDLSAILEDASIDEQEKGFIARSFSKLKLNLYKIGVKLGFSSRIKYSTDFDLRDFDISTIESLKVKKVFFTIEDCPVDDQECMVQNKKKPVTLKFLDTFFLNASILMPEDNKDFMFEEVIVSEQGDLVTVRPNAFQKLKKKEFKSLSEKAFTKKSEEFNLLEESNKEYYDLTLARVKIKKLGLFQSDNDQEEVKENITLILKSNPQIVDSIAQIKSHLKNKKVAALVKDTALVGENIFVELREEVEQKEFFKALALSQTKKESIGLTSMDRCTVKKCIILETDQRNLVPMLDKSSLLRFDTYISLDDLELNDFRYNGYVELEVKLDLPL